MRPSASTPSVVPVRFSPSGGAPGRLAGVRRFARLVPLILGLVAPRPAALAQAQQIEAAPPELLEAGAPPFVVTGAEGLGLNSPPTDLHLLSDGRVLVFSNPQIAIGDGVRWETYRHAEGDLATPAETIAIDRDDTIYVGVPGGFGRVVFSEDGQWRVTFVAPWPGGEHPQRPIPRRVIQLDHAWLWHSSSGSLIDWRPGRTARVTGQADTVEDAFEFEGERYVSDRPDGRLMRLLPDGKTETVLHSAGLAPGSSITCAVPFGSHRALVGTPSLGLQLFDGGQITPFLPSGPLAAPAHINDLCAATGGQFVAAVEDAGIIFFNRYGRILQVLDPLQDHRLAHVQRLVTATGGVIWGLAENAIVRVQFPSRVSSLETLVGRGMANIHPFRFAGLLWLQGDGQAYRGVYDASGRLVRAVLDSPPDREVFTLSTVTGHLLACTDRGAFVRTATGWEAFDPEVSNLRLLNREPIGGRWLCAAHHALGWLSPGGPHGVTLDLHPAPELENIFNTVVDRQGDFWMELGTGRVGRIHLENGEPVLRTFGNRDGVPDGWVQVYLLDGEVGFNIADQILRFDAATQRIVPDADFARRFPGLSGVVGRPGRDSLGRVWITANGGVQILEGTPGHWRNVHEKLPPGFQPFYFTFEDRGVVWLEGEHRIVRYDPAPPPAASPPLRALITQVTLPGSGRTIFPRDGRLPALAAADGSLIAHFLAPGNPFTPPATFEVKLDGTDTGWTSAGGAGSAAFNHLKEGRYVLRVRPVSGGEPGREAALAFVVRPPWYRTGYAYVAYFATALGVLWLAAWLAAFLERRETARLERLVAQRTGELNASNAQLARQLEEIGTLSQAITQSPVAVYITRPDDTIVFANPRACELAGYAADELAGTQARRLRAPEVAPATLTTIDEAVQQGEIWRGELANRRRDGRVIRVRTTVAPVRNAAGQIRHHLILEEDITEWVAEQERRRQLETQLFQAQKLEGLGTLAGGIAHDFNNILTGILGYCELARIEVGPGTGVAQDLDEIRAAGLRAKDLVAQILTFSRQAHASLVPLDLAGPVAEAIKLIRASTPATIEIVTRLVSGPVRADATQIHQIVVNLCTNALHAMQRRTGRLEIEVRPIMVDAALAATVAGLSPGPAVRLTVADSGEGMDEATLNRIFDPFFTTKSPGEGTGLGLSIVQGMVAAHGAAIRVRSSRGAGTTFEIYFPPTTETAAPSVAASTAPRGAGEEILIVDDEPSVAAFAAARLQAFGYRPTVFHDPREALAAFAAEPNRYHGVVTDLTMPHLTGIDLVGRLRLHRAVVPTVIVTGYGRELTREKLAAIPHCVVLQKPFTGEDLAQVLHQVMTAALAAIA